jgi:hypothetical protein
MVTGQRGKREEGKEGKEGNGLESVATTTELSAWV